jgi:uncharacterized protein YfaS (alpha-2-macroglobulin family)
MDVSRGYRSLATVALLLVASATTCAADDAVEASIDMDDHELLLEFDDEMSTWGNVVAPGQVQVAGVGALDCAWVNGTAMRCAFAEDQVVRNATAYTVRIGPGLATRAGEAFAPVEVQVETGRPQVQLRLDRWEDGAPVFLVRPDQQVAMHVLASAMRLELDGRPAPVRLERVEEDDENAYKKQQPQYRVLLPTLTAPTDVSLSLPAGLVGDEGPLRGTVGARLQALALEPFELRYVGCGGPAKPAAAKGDGAAPLALGCVAQEPLTLLFSQPLDEAAIARWRAGLGADWTFKEAAADTWSWWSAQYAKAPSVSPGFRVVVVPTRTNATLPLSLTGLAPTGIALPDLTVRTTGLRPRFAADGSRRLLADANAELATIHGAAAAPIRVVGLGRDLQRKDETLSAPIGTPVPVESAATRATLAEGGWVGWDGAGAPLGRSRLVEFAAPGFDLMALAGRTEVLAWANAFDRDEPVQGAKVELLHLAADAAAPRVMARATTDADGIARLHLPAGMPPLAAADRKGEMWFVRGAQAGHGQALLPLQSGYANELGDAPMPRAWGVVDRPLYHAGDTVRYRLWLREERDGHLRQRLAPRPVTLALRGGYDQELLRWTATADARGNVFGEVVVPRHTPDNGYCIHEVDPDDDGLMDAGICFYVGSYQAQDLWTELAVDRTRVRNGDVLTADLDAGYYSGGVASGVRVEWDALLVPVDVASVYPHYRGYAFAEEDADYDEMALASADRKTARTDAAGHARGTWPVQIRSLYTDDAPPRLPLLGRLRIVARAKLEGRADTVSPAAEVTYVGAEKFVGLRLADGWLDVARSPRLNAVVVGADGVAHTGAAVDVAVAFRPERKSGGKAPQDIPLGTCRLVAGTVAPCAFPRERKGRYVFTASSAGAASAEMSRWLWRIDAADKDEKPEAVLELAAPVRRSGEDVSLLLRQPFADARVLLLARDAEALEYRIQRVPAGDSQLAIAPGADWRGNAHASAFVREPVAAKIEAGERIPARLLQATVDFALPPPAKPAAPVSVMFTATSATPGEPARIRLHNDSIVARDVVVAVVDDGVRALAADWLEYFDPAGDAWLGGESIDTSWSASSFADWPTHDKVVVKLPWSDGTTGTRATGRVQSQTVVESRRRQGREPIASPAVEIQPEEFQYEGATELDSIVVTGTRIRRDTTLGGAGRNPMARVRDESPALRDARVRADFRDVALWVPDMRLAPGETRTLEVTLPDNLTRWRTIAWSSDADDGFAMAEATLASGLPLEMRVEAPVRLYPGDTAQVEALVHRTGAATRSVNAQLTAEGAGLSTDARRSLMPAAGGQAGFSLALAPKATGSIEVVATAATTDANQRDAVGAAIEVASGSIDSHLVQVGWLPADGTTLPLPALPAGAGPAQLHVALQRGDRALVSKWTTDMRDYPHRCWEQILSRAVAAALALERGDTAWADAGAAVREAQENAAVFQQYEGDFRYFVQAPIDPESDWYEDKHVGLTAYSLRAMGWLRALGQPLTARVDELAQDSLGQVVAGHGGELVHDAAKDVDAEADAHAIAEADAALEETALAMGALADRDALVAEGKDHRFEPAKVLDVLWSQWDRQGRAARLATTRALLRTGHRAASRALGRLVDAAPLRAGARHFGEDIDDAPWMGSALRDQCELIELLGAAKSRSLRRARGELVAGLTDLHAGGVAAIDTQSAAHCLWALRTPAAASAEAVRMHAAIGGVAGDIALGAGETTADWSAEAPAQGTLVLAVEPETDTPNSYAVELDFTEDANLAQATALGLRLVRDYAVLRGDKWVAVDAGGVRAGDWIRVTLTVTTPAPRYFVAITDAVPGGLRPTDLRLSGVAGLHLASLSDPGSFHFDARKLDARAPRFYAESLPAGRHVVHYFAHAAYAGDYLAAPAVAELMYGNGSRARTAATRMVVKEDDATTTP